MAHKAPFEDDTPLRFESARWLAQASPDPRVGKRQHRARLLLYDDSQTLTTAERGTRLSSFLEPDDR